MRAWSFVLGRRQALHEHPVRNSARLLFSSRCYLVTFLELDTLSTAGTSTPQKFEVPPRPPAARQMVLGSFSKGAVMQKLGKVSAEKVVRHKTYGTARKALGIKDIARKGTPREAATAFLKGIAPQLKIPADLGNLNMTRSSAALWAHTFSSSNTTIRNRLPVRGSK